MDRESPKSHHSLMKLSINESAFVTRVAQTRIHHEANRINADINKKILVLLFAILTVVLMVFIGILTYVTIELNVSTLRQQYKKQETIGKITDSPIAFANHNSNNPKPGEERSLDLGNGVKLVMCYIPSGECQLGSPKAERDAVFAHMTEEKEHPDWLKAEAEEVRGKYKTNGFWLAKFECTQEQYQQLMDKNPSYFGSIEDKGKGQITSKLPVDQVSWNDAQDFLKKLNGVAGRQELFVTSKKFVLPHEDQWEYAYRGGRGNKQAFYWGNSLNADKANHFGDYPFGTEMKGPSLERTTVVGAFATRAPHPWGLADMAGNVWEWCDNKYTNDDDDRTFRGGAWTSVADGCRGAYRGGGEPAFQYDNFGFRVCLPLD